MALTVSKGFGILSCRTTAESVAGGPVTASADSARACYHSGYDSRQ